MASNGFGGGRKLPKKREYFIDYGDGFDYVLDRCQTTDGCYKCKTKPIPILQHLRSADEHWIYLACPKHPKNRTYINLDYKTMFKSWKFLQKIGREELKKGQEENGQTINTRY
jgi:hypothetical protein